jgi:hypothetical protein
LTALNPEYVKIPVVAGVVGFTSFFLRNQDLYWALPLLGIVYMGTLFAVRLLPFDIQDEVGN